MGKKKVKGGAGIPAGGNVSFGDVSGQVAIGEFINQFKIEKPSGEALVKLMAFLDKKRQESFNKEILNKYILSELPEYRLKLRDFVTHNRADELTKALIYLQYHRILLISGIGGVGKTTLARALIETRPANVPLPFWFDFSKKMDATLGDVLEKLAGYMDAPEIARFRAEKKEAGQENINRLTGELQKREQLWLVFDNLETILDGTQFHDQGMDLLFTSLRNSTHKAKIIVASRTLPILKNGESLIDIIEEEKQELRGLKINFAIDYLIKNGLEKVEREKLEKLAIGVDGHPLALRLLIELIKKFGVADTLNDLSMFQKRKEDTIKKARRLFDKLAGDEKELLERISVFRKPEPMSAIKEMFTDKTSEYAVEELIDKSLLETDHKGKYWLHPLVKEFAYDDLKDKIEVHKLAFQYYLFLPPPEKRTKKEDVQPLIEAHYHACTAKEYKRAASIILDLDEDLDRWGNYRELIELHLDVLKPLLDIGTLGAVLGNLGKAYLNLGQVDKAIEYSQKSLAIAQEIGYRHNESIALGNLGRAYRNLGQVEKAIEHHQKALAVAQEIGDRHNESIHLGNLGNAYLNLEQVDKAIEYYQKALAIAQEIGDRQAEGAALGNLGNAYLNLEQVDKAIEYYQKALAVAQEIGNRRGESAWLGSLGLAYWSLGQVDKAIEYCQKALAIAQEIGDRQVEGAALGNLGNAYWSMGEVDKAIEYYQKALAIAQEIGDRYYEGTHLGSLGIAYRDLGAVDKAIEYYQKALAIDKEIGDRRRGGITLGNLGSAYWELGQFDKAIEYYQKALAIAKEIGDRRREGNHLNDLGVAFEDEKKYKEALACYLLAREIRTQIKDPNLITTESNLKNLKEELGEAECEKLAAEVAPRADEILRKILEGTSS